MGARSNKILKGGPHSVAAAPCFNYLDCQLDPGLHTLHHEIASLGRVISTRSICALEQHRSRALLSPNITWDVACRFHAAVTAAELGIT